MHKIRKQKLSKTIINRNYEKSQLFIIKRCKLENDDIISGSKKIGGSKTIEKKVERKQRILCKFSFLMYLQHQNETRS